MGPDPNHQGSSRRWIMRACEDSLRRLDTDYIDLFQIHRLQPGCDHDETLGALTDLVRAGKVRYLGSSTYPPSAIVEAQWVAERRGRERFVCEQPPYSLLYRGVESDALPTCQRYGMGVIPWGPLGGGWLSGRWRKGAMEMESSRANRVPMRYDLSRPSQPAQARRRRGPDPARRGRGPVAHPSRARLRVEPSGDHRGDPRPEDDGALREPDRRRRRAARDRRPRSHRQDRRCRAPTSTRPTPGIRRLPSRNPKLRRRA